jgi:hypothetical protein
MKFSSNRQDEPCFKFLLILTMFLSFVGDNAGASQYSLGVCFSRCTALTCKNPEVFKDCLSKCPKERIAGCIMAGEKPDLKPAEEMSVKPHPIPFAAAKKPAAMLKEGQGLSKKTQSAATLSASIKPTNPMLDLTYSYDVRKNEITFNKKIPPHNKIYLPNKYVELILRDPHQKDRIAPWLRQMIGLEAAKIVSFKEFKPDVGIASQHYKLTFDNKTSLFIKVEAGINRIGKQREADKIIDALGIGASADDFVFVKQLASVLVKFGNDQVNEIIIFPLIPGGEPKVGDISLWERMGRGYASFKIASMKYFKNYESFLKTGLIQKVHELPDFHTSNVLHGEDGKIYIIDYQLLRVFEKSSFCLMAMDRILFGAPSKAQEAFRKGFQSAFPESLKVQCAGG